MCCDVTVVFDLTFFNEVTKSDNILKNIEANVIDSCIEVIIGMPDIRSHRLVHCIPLYFDSIDPTYLVPPQGTSQSSTPSTVASFVRRDTMATSRAICKGSVPCGNCAFLIARGHDNTLCSLVGRPNTPQRRDTFQHRMFTDDELIRKKDIFSIGLVNYFRDHVPKMTEMVQPLRKLMDMKKYKSSKKLTWTTLLNDDVAHMRNGK